MTEIRLITANVDFALRPYMVKEDFDFLIEHADVITFQEAKRVDIDRIIRDKDWAVFQPNATDATKGSGIAWRKDKLKRKENGKSVGTKPFGRAMLTRYITWVRLEIDGQDIVFVSLHMPPKRFWGFLYANMLKNLDRFLAPRTLPVVVGADWNKLVMRAPDLQEFARRHKGSFHGVHIDGFLIIPKGKLKVKKTRKLRDTHSDHDPVQVIVEVDTAR